LNIKNAEYKNASKKHIRNKKPLVRLSYKFKKKEAER